MLKELRDKRARLFREAEALQGRNGTFANDQARTDFDAKMAEIEALDKEIRELDPNSEFIVERSPLDPNSTQQQRRAADEQQQPNERDMGADGERDRIQGILVAVRAARLPQSVADRLIKDKIPLVKAQAEVFCELAKRENEDVGPRPGPQNVRLGDDPMVHVRSGIENALQHRIAPAYFKLEDVGREYRGMTLMDVAKVYLNGINKRTTGMSRMEIAGLAMGLDYRSGYHTTSDFATLLADVARKTLRAAYAEAPQTFQPIARRVTLSDFKVNRRLQLGDAPNLLLVKEHGEFTRGTVGQGSETMQLETFGRIFAITRQALVNDDTDAFARVPMLFGRAARKKESDVVWAQITGNPLMGDGNALFSAAHGNLETDGDSLSIASLSRARLAIRLQTGLDGETQVNVVPKYLVVPPSLETIAEQIIAPLINAQLFSAQNIFAGKLTIIVEPRLEANSPTAWYLVAAPDQIDVIEYAYLEGEDGPAIENRVGFDVDDVS
jgi:phage major head subunit gpT-like protein